MWIVKLKTTELPVEREREREASKRVDKNI